MKTRNFVSFSPIPDIDHWENPLEEVPRGSRDKMTLRCPDTGEHYLFKYPSDEREHQIWSELVASYIAGDLLGWDVQFTGIARREGRLGNLMKYIYTHPNHNSGQETLIEGWSLCKLIDADFDQKKGNRHTLSLLMRVCTELLVPVHDLAEQEFLDFWAKALAFDTLISNRDRHAANWAIIKGRQSTQMAPLYDNGSSLGCEIGEAKLEQVFNESGTIKDSHLRKRWKKGRHHLRLDSPCEHGSTFEEGCSAFLEIHPEGRHWFEAAAGVEISAVCCLMESIATQSGVEKRYFLSPGRIRHICAILRIGVDHLRNVLHEKGNHV